MSQQELSAQELVALSKKHTLFEWSAQSTVDPIPVARAKGIYFWTPEGQRFAQWHGEMTHRHARNAPDEGMCFDQRWLDLVPALFAGAAICRAQYQMAAKPSA
jgi:hypothetical protein